MPQINLNGTSREALVHQQLDVKRALEATISATLSAMPHGRDYQFRPGEFTEAQAAWLDRIDVLTKLHNEIEAHALAIHNDGK
jgi:hypothetical protein